MCKTCSVNLMWYKACINFVIKKGSSLGPLFDMFVHAVLTCIAFDNSNMIYKVM